jgi:hypothetical protein
MKWNGMVRETDREMLSDILEQLGAIGIVAQALVLSACLINDSLGFHGE